MLLLSADPDLADGDVDLDGFPLGRARPSFCWSRRTGEVALN
jgi:hypothetical protein